jgi:ATP-dependent Lon protease
MRDFRDAKAMAQTLREALTTKAINISHSESLELISKILGVADWNTLSALLHAGRRNIAAPVTKHQTGTASYPAIPLRDVVPFPAATYPLFVGREKTMQALNHAFEGQRDIVLATQKEAGIDQPGFEDVYEIGVLAQLLELERWGDGTLKVLAQVRRRVMIRSFVGETGAFEAEIADISEGPIPEALELIQKTVRRFENYAAARDIRLPQTSPPLDQTHDPGRVADIIAPYLALPISDKQSLLATLDPVVRLRRIDVLIDFSVLPLSAALEGTRRRAVDYAKHRKHQYATLEHLLLALVDDTDACAAMQACNADLDALKTRLLGYLDNELKRLVIENGGDAKPSPAFHRVIERAARHAQELGRREVTGANMLLAIFPETQSPAARLLGEQGVSRDRAADVIARGVG